MLGGAVRIDDAENPQRAAAKLERHADRRPDHGEVEVQTEELESADPQQVGQAFHGVPKVEVAEPRHDRERRSEHRTLVRSRDP